MAVDVLVGEGSEGLVVIDADVSSCAGSQDAQRLLAVLSHHLSVVLEQHVSALAPADVGHLVLVTLNDQEDLQGLQHVVGVSVGTHADVDALLEHLQNGGAADSVAHVGLGVVDAHGAGSLDGVQLGVGQVDAVTQHGLLTQDAADALQTLNGVAHVVVQGVVNVVQTLCNVDVEAGQAVVLGDHLLKGLVGDGEQSMATEHSGDHVVVLRSCPAGELCVLLDGLSGLDLAVTLGNLVAQVSADADLLTDVLDGEQGAGDLTEGSVVVDDGGNAVTDGVQDGGVSASLGAVHGQVAVDVPPSVLQNFDEVTGVLACDGQATGQTGVDVSVGIDQAGHDNAALCVHELGVGVLGLHLSQSANFLDQFALDDDSAVFQVGVCGVAGNESAISYDHHIVFPPLNIGRFYIKPARAGSTTFQPAL